MLKKLASWKYGIAVVIILGFSIYVSHQDQKTRDQYEKECAKLNAGAVSPTAHREDCDKGAEDAARHLPRWYRVFGWSEGITTWAILLTLLALAEQTVQTKRAAEATDNSLSEVQRQTKAAVMSAKAARRQTLIAMNAQRAWVMGTIENVPHWNPSGANTEVMYVKPLFRNYGETPGRISEIKLRSEYLADGEELPPHPVYSGEEWYSSHFSGEIDLMPKNMVVQPVSAQLRGGAFVNVRKRQTRLYIYWVVNYRDIHGRKWHTRTCYRYHMPGSLDGTPEGYVIDGPAAYNQSGTGYYEEQKPK
jgi:hypothetical protein